MRNEVALVDGDSIEFERTSIRQRIDAHTAHGVGLAAGLAVAEIGRGEVIGRVLFRCDRVVRALGRIVLLVDRHRCGKCVAQRARATGIIRAAIVVVSVAERNCNVARAVEGVGTAVVTQRLEDGVHLSGRCSAVEVYHQITTVTATGHIGDAVQVAVGDRELVEPLAAIVHRHRDRAGAEFVHSGCRGDIEVGDVCAGDQLLGIGAVVRRRALIHRRSCTRAGQIRRVVACDNRCCQIDCIRPNVGVPCGIVAHSPRDIRVGVEGLVGIGQPHAQRAGCAVVVANRHEPQLSTIRQNDGSFVVRRADIIPAPTAVS